MRYFLELAYKGTRYSGWQVQANAHTVQAELDKALSILLKTDISTMGSGRTDAGVNASHQVAHFDTTNAIIEESKFIYKLNALLPQDIAIHRIRRVKDEAHARFDAEKRAYKYFIHRSKNPFFNNDSYFFNHDLDESLISSAIEILKQTEDFKAFSKVHTEVNHFRCKIFECKWEPTKKGYVFYICADRFLRGMVRALVGTLLDVGMKRTSLDELNSIINKKDRRDAGRAVPAEGLYLCDVQYPADIYQ